MSVIQVPRSFGELVGDNELDAPEVIQERLVEVQAAIGEVAARPMVVYNKGILPEIDGVVYGRTPVPPNGPWNRGGQNLAT